MQQPRTESIGTLETLALHDAEKMIIRIGLTPTLIDESVAEPTTEFLVHRPRLVDTTYGMQTDNDEIGKQGREFLFASIPTN